MKRFSSLLVIAICPLLASCFYNRTTSLNPEASIVVVRKADAPKECQEMGAVAGNQGIEAQNFIGIIAMETPEGAMSTPLIMGREDVTPGVMDPAPCKPASLKKLDPRDSDMRQPRKKSLPSAPVATAYGFL